VELPLKHALAVLVAVNWDFNCWSLAPMLWGHRPVFRQLSPIGWGRYPNLSIHSLFDLKGEQDEKITCPHEKAVPQSWPVSRPSVVQQLPGDDL